MTDQSVQEAVEFLTNGEVIAYPTDTLFGLGVDALNEEAIEYLYLIKQRSKHRPMSIMAPPGHWRNWVKNVSKHAEQLAERFFPGPITLIMNAGPEVPKILTRYTNGTIGIRIPDHATCQALLNSFRQPIITTSANLSNQPAARDAETIRQYFDEKVSYILSDGPKPGGIASTVVDVTEGEPVVLREGAIPEFAIWRATQ